MKDVWMPYSLKKIRIKNKKERKWEKYTIDIFTGKSSGSIFFLEIPSSQMTLGGFKLS